jgi:hypothetical protein
MASIYLDPGVYIQEVVVPTSANVTSIPLTATLVGIGSRNKRVNNEAVTRGLVSSEGITVSSTVGAHTATLASISNRKSANLVVYASGTALDSSDVTFVAPTKVGATLTTLDFTTNNRIALALDGKMAVTIAITTGVGDSTTIVGSVITQQLDGAPIALMTATLIADGINKALGGALSLGYGGVYAAVATVVANQVVLTSPINTSASDVRLYAAYPASQTVAVFGGTVPFQAPTVIKVSDIAYVSTATYTATYVATNTDTDTLINTDIQSMVRVGSYASVSTFTEGTDYSRTGSVLSWALDAAAVLISSRDTANKLTTGNNKFMLSVDGRGAIEITVTAGVAVPNATIVTDINTIMAASSVYGPRYSAVAGVSGDLITLTSANEGVGSSVEIANSGTMTTVDILFGLTAVPYSVYGTGKRPVASTVYFASYDYTRPTSDYNLPKRYFTADQVHADIGNPTSTNQLAIATDIAFENGAPSVFIVQVNDASFPGSPTQSEILAAINATNETDLTTEICILTTALQSQADLVNNIIDQNSPTQKNARRGWFGMARGTLIGDKDTPDTYVYRAQRTLQVPGDSPGRGRMIIVAPSNISRDITREDGSISNVLLDGSYAAVAIAAKMTSFGNVSDTLLRKNISGFKLDDFQTFLKAERAILASNGVTVITNNGGNLMLMDPVSTEAGGLTAFQEISASTQKDATTRAINQVVEANLVGVVPSDLAQFILTIKGYIGNALRTLISQGSIAPFKTADGVSRDVDFSKDIQVFQSSTNQTEYNFRYTFNIRYPAKRMMGTYSVDSPFW